MRRPPPRVLAPLFATLLTVTLSAQKATGDGSTTAGAAPDWRAFRGTDGRATSTGPAPREWSDDEHIAWRTALPGPGTSSPVVAGDAVLVTCWSGYAVDPDVPGEPSKLRRHLLRLDRKTGRIEWTVDVPPVDSEDEFGGRMATHGYASSTPVTDGERVYVFFGKSGVFAYDLAGKKLWQKSVGTGSSEWKTGSGSSLALDDGRLFVTASDESHSIRALRATDGEELWTRATPDLDQAYATPLVTPGPEPVVVIPLLGAIWGLEPATGKPRWTVKTVTNGALAPSAILGPGGTQVISFGGQTEMRSYSVRLGGTGDVTGTHIAWSTRYGSYVTTPLLYRDHLYWVNETGIYACNDARTGELVFRKRLQGAFYASPVRAGDAIYLVSRDAGTYVLAAKPEFEQLAHNELTADTSTFDATPAFAGGALFLRSRKFVYCIRD